MEDIKHDELEQAPEEKEKENAGPNVVTTLEKEEISEPESKVNTVMTIGSDEPVPGQNTTVSTVSLVSPASVGRHSSAGTVAVKIAYPKGWKKDKHFKDGDIKEVAPETADQFIKAGYASVVEKDKSE